MDETFIRECVISHGPKLVAYARSLCGDSEIAKDAAQDTFVKLCEMCMPDKERIASWLYMVCRNKVFDAMRKNSRMVPGDDGYFNSLVDASISPDICAERLEGAENILAHVSALPQKQREILMLRYYSDMGYGEISEIMGIPAGSVGITISRALGALKVSLKRKGLHEYGA